VPEPGVAVEGLGAGPEQVAPLGQTAPCSWGRGLAAKAKALNPRAGGPHGLPEAQTDCRQVTAGLRICVRGRRLSTSAPGGAPMVVIGLVVHGPQEDNVVMIRRGAVGLIRIGRCTGHLASPGSRP
jgi:hypothetical protein